MAWLWQFKRSPLRDANLGFVDVPSALADQLVAEGSASRVYDRFKRLDYSHPTPLAPPITGISMVAGPGISPDSPSGTLVGTLSCTGGTAPFTYTLPADDGGNFSISGDTVVTARTGLSEGAHTFTVQASDAMTQTRTSPKSTTVAAA